MKYFEKIYNTKERIVAAQESYYYLTANKEPLSVQMHKAL